MEDTVLVTGGAGFIGSHSVEALLAYGCRVRVLDNFSSGDIGNLPAHDNLEVIEGDIRKPEDLRRAMAGVGRCLHLAAQVSVAHSVERPCDSAENNILGTLRVLEAARDHGVPRVVYASSAAVYGEPESLPLTETARISPLSPYGLEKWVNERYASLFQTLHGLSSLGLRYFNVYGPRQSPSSPYAGVITRFVDCLSMGKAPTIYGDGEQTRDFIYVADVARFNLLALFADRDGVCNVATQRRTSLLELVEALQRGLESHVSPRLTEPRGEDIRHSLGSAERLIDWLGEAPSYTLDAGLGVYLADMKFSR